MDNQTSIASRPLGQGATAALDRVADTASNAIRATRGASNAAFDKMSNTVDNLHTEAAPVIGTLADQAATAAQRSADFVRETSMQMRDRANLAKDTTVGYIKDEPIKAMLVAAAVGAALMALISLMGRARANDR